MSNVQNISDSLMFLKRFENYQIVRSFSGALLAFTILSLTSSISLLLNRSNGLINSIFKQIILTYIYSLNIFLNIVILGYIILDLIDIRFSKGDHENYYLSAKIKDTKVIDTLIVTKFEKVIIIGCLIVCLLDICIFCLLLLTGITPFLIVIYSFKFISQLLVLGYLILNFFKSRKTKEDNIMAFIQNKKNLILVFLIVCTLDFFILSVFIGIFDPFLNLLPNYFFLNNLSPSTFINIFQFFFNLFLGFIIVGYVIFTFYQLAITKNDHGVLKVYNQKLLGIVLLGVWAIVVLFGTWLISLILPLFLLELNINFSDNIFVSQAIAYQISIIFSIVIIYIFLKTSSTKVYSFKGLFVVCIIILFVTGFSLIVAGYFNLFNTGNSDPLQYLRQFVYPDTFSNIINFFTFLITISCAFYLYYKSKAILDGSI